MPHREFATCLCCMDGRVQIPVIEWIRKHEDVDYVDMITEAGIDGALACGSLDMDVLTRKIAISTDKHGSHAVYIVGHHDCGGNQVDSTTHKEQVCADVGDIKALFPSCKVVGLWVDESWKVKPICQQ